MALNNQVFISSEKAQSTFNTSEYRMRSACYKIFSSDIIKENNIFFKENIFNGEDGLFVFEYLQCVDNYKYVPVSLWNVLERNDSATMSAYNSKLLTALDSINLMLCTPDLSVDTINTLKAYYVERGASLLIKAVTDNSADSADIKYLRTLIKTNKADFLKIHRTVKNYVYINILWMLPLKVLKLIFK